MSPAPEGVPPVPQHGVAPAAPMASSAPPVLDSRALFGAGREIHIDHLGQVYRLRHTANGKLILTK
jgi:hemin uptake protein HemP